MSFPTVPQQRQSSRLVPLAGEFDIATANQLYDAINHPGENLVLDLTSVTFMDASALGVIASAARLLAETGGSLRVTGATPHLEKVFRLAQFHALLSPTA
ncbi:MAG: hypothetical protein QOI23_654 [Chloroflexota bacterium]|jgi:anti-anti-sigma factor|nr:hypothetical protein [Chloroflexota bacterium]